MYDVIIMKRNIIIIVNYSNNSSFSKNNSCNFEQRVYVPGELDKLYCNFEILKEGE